MTEPEFTKLNNIMAEYVRHSLHHTQFTIDLMERFAESVLESGQEPLETFIRATRYEIENVLEIMAPILADYKFLARVKEELEGVQ